MSGEEKKKRHYVNGNLKGGSKKASERKKHLEEVRQILERVMLEEKNGVTALEHMFLIIREKALQGDRFYIKMILEYLYGTPDKMVAIDHNIRMIEPPTLIFLDEAKNEENADAEIVE